jgi:ubiquinone biosynthesis protein COQ9
MTFEAFREREERIAADIVEKLSQKQNIGDIVNQLADQLTAEFKESLSQNEKIVHQLAEKHLKTRYSVSKSNGFQQWLKERKS